MESLLPVRNHWNSFTLYLGVLYHMMAPLVALQKVAELTREVAMIETAATFFPGLEHLPLCEFYDRDELLFGDPTNYWAPNIRGLISMCRAAGFKKVDVRAGPRGDGMLHAGTSKSVRDLLRRVGLKRHGLPPLFRYRAIVMRGNSIDWPASISAARPHRAEH